MKKQIIYPVKSLLFKRVIIAATLTTFFSLPFWGGLGWGQNIGINSTGNPPNASAGLDIDFTNKGLLIPRVTECQRITAGCAGGLLDGSGNLPAIAPGLLVYQTNATLGFYYNTSTTVTPTWVQISGGGNGWSLTGNAGTTAGTNFVGTTDDVSLVFKVNGSKAGQIDAPSAMLQNTAYGYEAEFSNTMGTENTAIGFNALYSNNVGEFNTAIGSYALYSDNGLGRNTAVGANSMVFNIDGTFNSAFGMSALYFTTSGNENVALGLASLYGNTTGSRNTALGTYALYSNVAGANATAIGYMAMYYANSNAIPFINYNVALGYEALCGPASPATNTGNFNTAIGYQSLKFNAIGNINTAIGFQALYQNASGDYNTACGANALQGNSSGVGNTAIGYGAGYTDTPANANWAGSNNTFIGYNSGPGSTAQLTNATAIGYKALVNADNALVLGGTGANSVNVGIGTQIPNTVLDVNGSFAIREGTALSLANGANNDIALGAFSYFRITGPTAAFTISGFTGGVDGRILTLYNTTSQVMTIANNITSSAANQILTITGTDIVTPAGPNVVQLQYNANVSRWIVIGGQKLTAVPSTGSDANTLIYTVVGF